MRRIILLLAATAVGITLSAAKKQPHSEANLEVKYKYEYAASQVDTLKYKSDDMLLQIAPGESRFFSIKTEFYDSLMATPGGKKMVSDMQLDALNKSGGIKRDASGEITAITVSAEVFKDVPQRAQTFNVYKYPEQNAIMVYDCLPGTNMEYNTWSLPADEIEWEPGDSTAVFLGYECQNATADYHGRRWTAWFAPDIPVSEGPWQLCGLPGLILMAETDGAEYRFTAVSLNECKEMIKDMPGNPVVEKCDRKEFRRQQVDLAKNPGKRFGYGSMFKDEFYHDLIETDYND